jgi:hypothetical protein
LLGAKQQASLSFFSHAERSSLTKRQPKTGPNLLLIGYDLLKGRPDNRDQRASQSTATIKFGI